MLYNSLGAFANNMLKHTLCVQIRKMEHKEIQALKSNEGKYTIGIAQDVKCCCSKFRIITNCDFKDTVLVIFMV